MTTHRITKWTAKRAGAGMTVTGTGPSGEPVKLTRVAEITWTAVGPVALLAPTGDRVNLA